MPPAVVSAQARAKPFETIDLGLTLLTDVNRGVLQQYWSPGPGVALGATLPFYVGQVEAGGQYAHPSARHGDVPGFRSLFIYAGWGLGHDLGHRLHAGGGLRLGLYAMRFDGDTLPDFRRRESELALALRGAVRWMPAGNWFTEAAVTYQSVYTQQRIEQVFLSVGFGRRFGTPAWLRDFLD